jgi:hypothetical protein
MQPDRVAENSHKLIRIGPAWEAQVAIKLLA